MNYFKKIAIVSLAIISLLFTSCEDADDNDNRIDPNNSAYDLTENNPDLSMLNTALIRTGLNFTLDSQGTYTVFAPNDAAFSLYLTANGFANLEAVPIDELRDLLLYHVLNTNVTTTLLDNGYLKTLGKDEDLEALDLFIEASSPILLNGNTSITEADIEVDNGVVHIIDSVLELPTITDLIAANPEFSNLYAALSLTGLSTTLSSEVGTMQAPFTVLAPNDVAFQALIDIDTMDGLNTVQDILDLTNLNDILLYHVVGNDRIRSGDFSNGFAITPISGGTYMIDTMSGIQFVDGSMTTATITSTDVTAVNGIIHTISIVIRPM